VALGVQFDPVRQDRAQRLASLVGPVELSAELLQVRRGHGLHLLGLGAMGGAQVVSRTSNMLIVEWGPYRTFTIDLAAGRVTYAESSDNTEGRGEFTCEVMR
jgi:hypothetical protein